ncbi:hypothetical protein CORT_0F04610 [Candida orthopsilosis Co 90-125]|uniref:Small nuclear ribonucleoprotein E n=1 Tax=Candida orthopsilosis (strain 90-125) TaxID=1136231 RepID=H8X9M0_CANO9|nr:hypothetical protein CORT_0F04610 [Candida orthopsilosis Co 90-125]CCG24686.1 hypothetical protein CORT_0F04610 [Candida orthopsilosis Co 90-125]
MSSKSVSKTNLPPINLIFKFLQQQSLVTIWLYEKSHSRIQGKIQGFDEYMNLVIDEAEEIVNGKKTPLGKLLLKGENITLISSLDV